jgi:predicted outer membrane repeat protein
MHNSPPRKRNSCAIGMPSHTPLFTALAVIGCAIGSTLSGATTFPVGKCGDMAGKGGDTLRIAIGKAGDGDTVDMGSLPLTCSTITLTGGEIPIAVASLTIQGPAGRTVTVSGNNVGRVFYHNVGGGLLTLSGFEVAYGQTVGAGGCIYTTGEGYLSGMIASHCHAGTVGGAVAVLAALNVVDSTIYASSADQGGGGIAVSGVLHTGGSVVTGNSAPSGGGIYAATDVFATATSITHNDAASGGGIFSKGTAHLVTAIIDQNTADGGYGGGAYAKSAIITTSLISNNKADYGAGMAVLGSSFSMTASTVAGNGNAATVKGGGLLIALGTSNGASIENSTISGNVAQQCGGAYVRATGVGATGFLTLYNSTVAFNDSPSGFGGIGVFSPNIFLQSSILARNSPMDFGVFPGVTHTTSGTHNLMMTGTEAPLGTLIDDPRLTPLALHGGLLPTHALSANSAAIDHGVNPSLLDYDERGAGFARSVGNGPDIGAYERQVGDDELFYDGFD